MRMSTAQDLSFIIETTYETVNITEFTIYHSTFTIFKQTHDSNIRRHSSRTKASE